MIITSLARGSLNMPRMSILWNKILSTEGSFNASASKVYQGIL